MQGQYMIGQPILAPPQVPWMSMGPNPRWTQPQFPWTMQYQLVQPLHAASLPLPVSALLMPKPIASPKAPVVSGPQLVTGPVTTTTMTTTVPVGAQPPTPLPAPMMNTLPVCDTTGIALQIKISNHVPITV